MADSSTKDDDVSAEPGADAAATTTSDTTTSDTTTSDTTTAAGGTTGRRSLGRRRAAAAATDAATDATGADAGSTTRSRRRAAAADGTRPSRLSAGAMRKLLALLTVLVVLLGIVLAVELIRSNSGPSKTEQREDRREAARTAAENAVPRLYSYNFNTIDADIATQQDLTIGPLQDQIKTQTAPALKSLAPKTTAVVQAVVLGSAVTDDTNGPDVKVLVFMNQAVSSNLLSAPRLDRNRVLATMHPVGNQWKVSAIELL